MDLERRERAFYPHLYLSPPYKGALRPPRTWEGKQFSIDCASGFWFRGFFNAIPAPPQLKTDEVLLPLVLVDRTFEYEIENFSTLCHPKR